MTTATQHHAPDGGGRVLLGTARWTLVPAVAMVVAGGLFGGSPGALGAVVGAVLVLGISIFGLVTVNAVASLMPMASLMFAMLTYTLQVVLMAVAFIALQGSGLLDDTLDRAWLGCTVIVCVLAWLVAQIVLTTRQRIPAFDLPERPAPETSEAGAR